MEMDWVFPAGFALLMESRSQVRRVLPRSEARVTGPRESRALGRPFPASDPSLSVGAPLRLRAECAPK